MKASNKWQEKLIYQLFRKVDVAYKMTNINISSLKKKLIDQLFEMLISYKKWSNVCRPPNIANYVVGPIFKGPIVDGAMSDLHKNNEKQRKAIVHALSIPHDSQGHLTAQPPAPEEKDQELDDEDSLHVAFADYDHDPSPPHNEVASTIEDRGKKRALRPMDGDWLGRHDRVVDIFIE